MFTFDMTLNQDFASFRDSETGRMVFVDTFDNKNFNVRFGTASESKDLGTIIADSDASLNDQLRSLIDKQNHGNHSS